MEAKQEAIQQRPLFETFSSHSGFYAILNTETYKITHGDFSKEQAEAKCAEWNQIYSDRAALSRSGAA